MFVAITDSYSLIMNTINVHYYPPYIQMLYLTLYLHINTHYRSHYKVDQLMLLTYLVQVLYLGDIIVSLTRMDTCSLSPLHIIIPLYGNYQ